MLVNSKNLMKIFIIHLSLIPKSLEMAKDVLNSLKKYHIDVELFEGTYGYEADELFKKQNRTLHPTYYKGKLINSVENKPGHKGCFYSHFRLWQKCIELNESIMIFEDDVKIYRGYEPVDFDEILILSIGVEWKLSEHYMHHLKENKGRSESISFIGECMMGTSGYAITPLAAQKLVDVYKNSYTAVDHAMNKDVIKLQIHNKLMGRSIHPDESNKSLTKNYNFSK